MSRVTAATTVSSLGSARSRGRLLGRTVDYLELTKPRIVALELVTVIVAAHLASPLGVDPWVLLHTVCGAALVAASAGAWNQWWEQAADAQMPRTAIPNSFGSTSPCWAFATGCSWRAKRSAGGSKTLQITKSA